MSTTCTETFIDIIHQFHAPAPENANSVPVPFEGISEVDTPILLQPKSSSIPESEQEDIQERLIKDEYFKALNLGSRLSKTIFLETFNSFHMECAEALINVFFKIKLADLKKAIVYARTRLNEQLLNYVLSVVLRHRDDAITENIQIPSHVCTTPEMYFDMGKIGQQFQNEKLKQKINDETSRKAPIFVVINSSFTATDMDPEHRVAYFREDIAVNLHHRHWHEVYPFIGSKEIVNKDRRGELFYYMHQQIVARYNYERFCNNLAQAEPFSDFREPIKEAYFPKLDTASNTKLWSSRQAFAVIKDIRRDNLYCKVTDLEHWRERLFEAIDRGYVYVKNSDDTETLKKLTEPEAINDLGNTIESVSNLSWNPGYYGDIHNKGHLFFSYCHDPDYRFKEEGSVMSHSETALRDPIFYRWHVFIDDMFQDYKRKLPPYTVDERSFPNVEIEDVTVVSQDVEEKNVFKTFWQKDIVEITTGLLNLNPEKDGSVFAIFSHLQHKSFTYKINVVNSNPSTVTGTVRIFIAPKSDESGIQMNFNRQRRMFIELDKFSSTLQPGNNLIERESTSSSVTIPFEQSFMTTEDAKKYTKDGNLDILSYCGCGWPQHLLIGKGTLSGFKCQLFVMITDYETDKVEDNSSHKDICSGNSKSAISYCGVRDQKYPDKKPMGFPFDRNISDYQAKLTDFITKSQLSENKENPSDYPREDPLPNMKVVDVNVKFFDEEVDGASILSRGYSTQVARAMNVSA